MGIGSLMYKEHNFLYTRYLYTKDAATHIATTAKKIPSPPEIPYRTYILETEVIVEDVTEEQDVVNTEDVTEILNIEDAYAK